MYHDIILADCCYMVFNDITAGMTVSKLVFADNDTNIFLSSLDKMRHSACVRRKTSLYSLINDTVNLLKWILSDDEAN